MARRSPITYRRAELLGKAKANLETSAPHTGHAVSIVESSYSPLDDWSFAHLNRVETLWGPHGYHRYPAKFIPQLVRRVIEKYSEIDALVGDPFLGSATTGVEALRTRRRFWGADINPVALLISRAKCVPINPSRLDRVWERLDNQLQLLPSVGRRPLTRREKAIISEIDIVRASKEERLAYWFPARHAQVLDNLLQQIQEMPGETVRTFFLCAFSNILRRCSIWLSGSTKPQKDLEKTLSDPVDAFRMQAHDMVRRNRLYWDDLTCSGITPTTLTEKCYLTLKDARKLSLKRGAIDLLVSSPPYATCYEYTEIHQLTQLWLERYHLLPSDRWQLACIGSKYASARRLSNGRNPDQTGSILADAALAKLESLINGSSGRDVRREVTALRHYFQDMRTVLKEFARIVAPDKRMVLIVGDSRKRGITIPTSATICEMATAAGFELESKIVRKIPVRVLVITRSEKTGRFSSAARSDARAYPEEDILVFKRQA